MQGYADATARIRGGSSRPKLRGTVQFFQESDSVLVVAEISGLPQSSETGFFALHIHEGTDCGGEGFSATGGHFNPTGQMHPMHAGDLPPLLMYRDDAYLAVRTARFRVADIIGRTVMIHSGPDDLYTQPAGNAGVKIGCGVIQGKRKPCKGCARQL